MAFCLAALACFAVAEKIAGELANEALEVAGVVQDVSRGLRHCLAGHEDRSVQGSKEFMEDNPGLGDLCFAQDLALDVVGTVGIEIKACEAPEAEVVGHRSMVRN